MDTSITKAELIELNALNLRHFEPRPRLSKDDRKRRRFLAEKFASDPTYPFRSPVKAFYIFVNLY